VIRDHPNISRSLHLPLQSGSDRILKLMNRGYTLEHYLNIVDEASHIMGDFAVSTDLIVGFPGETDEEFRATLRAVREIRFDEAYMYAYSPRSGTAAAELTESISKSEKLARLNELISLQRGISIEKMTSRIDGTENALIESISKKSPREVLGKTFLNHPVVLPGIREDIGTLVRVKITGIRGGTLYGARVA
jgi:tRNA-2-methylthio-N6-dimethylallyladenosine synthase